MMTAAIKHLSLEESIEILYFLNNYAFRPTPPLPEFDEFSERIRGRYGIDYYGLFENGKPQAICAGIAFKQNLRGRIVPMGGVASVSTHPAARRKGYVRQLMHELYKKFNNENVGVSCLYPFKELFYQRMGYVTLPQPKIIQFEPKPLAPILKLDLNGHVELKEFYKNQHEYQAFLEKIQKQIHGMAVFTKIQNRTENESAFWLAFAKQNEKIIGMIRYDLTGEKMFQTLTAHDFLYINNNAKFLLLDWIARHIDQATKIKISLQPGVNGELFYTDIRPQFEGLAIAPMARVINVESLNGLPCGSGEINLEIIDPDCEWNNGIWHFDGRDGYLTLSRASKAKYTLSIQALTGLIYGVYRSEEFAFRNWAEIDNEGGEILNAMFPPDDPFLHAMY